MRRQMWVMVAVVTGVAYVDQISKAWAWRNRDGVLVNSGGDLLVCPTISDMFRNRVVGAVFDVVDAALIVAALLLLARRHRAPGVLPFGSLLLAGWLSNLADRLGMHYWTAPGSVRGAVDFLPYAGYYWNVADIAIIVGAVGLVPALFMAALRRGVRPVPAVPLVRRPLQHSWVRAAVVVGVVTVVGLAVVGAVVGGGLDSPEKVFAATGP